MIILNETKRKYIMSHLKRIKRDLTECTASDIEEVIVAIKAARTILSTKAMKTFMAGARIKFSHNSSWYRGYVVKKGVKYVQVKATLQDAKGHQRSAMQSWRVPAANLELDEAA
jgi:hypothetical protein